MKNGRLRAVAYIRVSDPSQVDGYSLDAQRAEIERWCVQQGHDLVRVYSEDGVTARSERIERRPQLVQMLKDGEQKQFELVVVHNLDRWSRNVGVQRQAFQRLGEAGVGFFSIQEGVDFTTPEGKLVLTMMGAVSEFFSDQLAFHVSKAQRQRAERGLPAGPIPFGYSISEPGGVPQVEPEEAEAVREVYRRRAGGASMGEIASWLNDEGLRTRKGRLFTAHAIKDMLCCRFYVGVVPYRGEESPGKHEAIISEDLYREVQARRRQKTFRRKADGPRSPFQGLSSCLRCGNPLQADRHRYGGPMLRERHSHPCETNGQSSVTHHLEGQVGVILASPNLDPSWRGRMAKLAVEPQGGPSLAALEEKRRRLGRAYADGAYGDAEYERLRSDLDARIRQATAVEVPTLEEAAALFGDISQLWAEATSDERRRLVTPFVERFYIDMEEKRIGAITPSPPFRRLLERALNRSNRSDVLLVSPEELERPEVWRWWRRGRVELPVQRRAGLRHYRRFRRLVLVRRAVAGPASPDTADES